MVVTTVHEGKRDRRDSTISQTAWLLHNFSEDTTFDCDSASNAELADALATLVGQLMELGILKGVVGTGTP